MSYINYKLFIMSERLEFINGLIPVGFTAITCVDDLEGMYAVNELGDIWSVRKLGLLNNLKHRLGYLQVYLTYFHGGGRWHKVHRLVAMQFIPNTNSLSDVNHKNGIKDDNRVENLEWLSHRDNIKHSYEVLGRVHIGTGSMKKISCSNGKVYDSAVQASKELGLFTSNISMCCNGKIRKTGGFSFSFV